MAPEFVTGCRCGERPVAPNVNHSGQTVPKAVIVPASADNEVRSYSLVETHLRAALNG